MTSHVAKLQIQGILIYEELVTLFVLFQEEKKSSIIVRLKAVNIAIL